MKAITRELEETRKEYQAQIDKLKAEKGQGEAGLRRQLEDSRRQMEEQARAAASHLQRVEMERDATVAALRERLRALQADREADAKHLHAKIDRLKNIHSAALSAGSARGRSLLYAEAMKSPEVLKHSTMTWRGEDWVPTGHSVNSQTLHLPEGYSTNTSRMMTRRRTRRCRKEALRRWRGIRRSARGQSLLQRSRQRRGRSRLAMGSTYA